MKYAICNEIFQGWPIEKVCAHAASLGYGAVEIAPFTMAPLVTQISAGERHGVRESAKSAGIEICGIHWVLAQTDGFYLNHPDSEIRGHTADYLADLVEFCSDLGGKTMVIGSPKQRDVLPELAPEEAWDYAGETLDAAIFSAEDRGISL